MVNRIWTYARTFNPRWVISALVFCVLLVNLYNARWTRSEVISPQVMYYYDIIPSMFSAHTPERAPAEQQGWPTIGMALSYLPFYALAWIFAYLGGFPTDGYSAPFQFAVEFSSLVYFVIGLIFLGKLLRLHFPGLVSSITMLVIAFGTNSFYYLTSGAGMPHAVSFMLVVLFVYQAIAWHQLRNMPSASQLGLLWGALWLVRPLNALLIIVFLLYDVRHLRELMARIKLFARKSAHLVVVLCCAVAVVIPQLLYWRFSGGSAFPEGSMDLEGFHFKRPHILQGIFSFHSGWLIHTPLMLFAVTGLFFMHGALRMYAWAVPVLFIVYVYVVFSWWCWWHGPSFGQRTLIDIYGLLAVPLGAFIFKLRRLGGMYKRVMYLCVIFFIAMNLWRCVINAGAAISEPCVPGQTIVPGRS